MSTITLSCMRIKGLITNNDDHDEDDDGDDDDDEFNIPIITFTY